MKELYFYFSNKLKNIHIPYNYIYSYIKETPVGEWYYFPKYRERRTEEQKEMN
jgi:hypothetical protein